MEGHPSVSDAKPDRQLGHSRSQELAVEKIHAPPSSQRSLARSIGIVATCTAAMLVVVRVSPLTSLHALMFQQTSNATSVSISLPLIGKAIDIQENQLQWLISAYSLTSVSPHSTLSCLHANAAVGMSYLVFRASRGSLWAQKGFPDRHALADGFCAWFRIRKPLVGHIASYC